MYREEIQNILSLFSVRLVLKDAAQEQKRRIRKKQNLDIRKKLYVAAVAFIFVQLFFIISDLITGFYTRIHCSWLNLSAEIIIAVSSVFVVLFLLSTEKDKTTDRVRDVQFVYYLALVTGILLYLLSDMIRDLKNIYNAFYNLVVLAIFAVYSFPRLAVLSAYVVLGTAAFFLALPDRFSWETCQMLPLLFLLFFLCANFFRAGNTRRFYTEVEIEELAAKMDALSTRDFLTKLPNRTALNRFLTGPMGKAAGAGRSAGLLMLDIDDFKAFNDFHSHLDGDSCLRQTGKLLLTLQNEKFHVFRFGGEEFLVIGLDITREELLDFAAAVHRELRTLAVPRGDEVNREGVITLSIGCSLAPLGPGMGYDELLRSADRALYTAKRSGKNCTVFQDRKYDAFGRLAE